MAAILRKGKMNLRIICGE